MFQFRVNTFINGNWHTAYRRDQIRKLRKIGAYTRTAMRGLLRKRKGPSQPHSPPHVHSNKLKGAVRFAVDETAMSVLTGPMIGESRVAQIINEGGPTQITSGRNTGKRYVAVDRNFTGPTQAKMQPDIARIISE